MAAIVATGECFGEAKMGAATLLQISASAKHVQIRRRRAFWIKRVTNVDDFAFRPVFQVHHFARPRQQREELRNPLIVVRIERVAAENGDRFQSGPLSFQGRFRAEFSQHLMLLKC